MKLISWNVNGLRACIQKGFLEQFDRLDADFFCLQETKLQEGQIQLELPGYQQYWCYAEKKGYSGTAIFTKHTPLSVSYGIGVEDLDKEGRVITLEYPEFYLVTCYTPNAQRGLARIDHRMKWDEAFRAYLKKLDEKHPVIICGDLNVAHQEIDLKNPQSNRGNAGFSDQERESFTKTLELGFTDTFRHLRPNATGIYSWWSYMYNARENNAGWRIDYFLVSDRIKEQVFRAPIYTDIMGSDHCPVGLELDILCNGSMWSPSSMGKARDVTPEPKKKAPASARAVLVSLLLLLALGAGFFTRRIFLQKDLPEETSPAPTYHFVEPELFRINQYTTALAQQYHSPTNLTSMKQECLYVPTSFRKTYYYLGNSSPFPSPGAPLAFESPANFFINITLTEEGLERYSNLPIPNIILKEQSTPLLQTSLRTFYADGDLENPAGWMFYGFTLEPVEFIITLGTETSLLRVEPMKIDLSGELFSLYLDEYVTDDEWAMSSQSDRLWDRYSTGGVTYPLGDATQAQADATRANFAVRMELTELGRQFVALGKLTPTVTAQEDVSYDWDDGIIKYYTSGAILPAGSGSQIVVIPDGTEVPLTVQRYSAPFYGPGDYGYVIFGNSDGSTTLTVTLGDDIQTLEFTPYLTSANLYGVRNYAYRLIARQMTVENQSVSFFADGYARYIVTTPIPEATKEEWNFFLRIWLTDEGKEYFQKSEPPTVAVINAPGSTASDAQVYMCPYHLQDSTEIDGWIICGHISQPESLMITLQEFTEQISIYPLYELDEDFDVPVDDG